MSLWGVFEQFLTRYYYSGLQCMLYILHAAHFLYAEPLALADSNYYFLLEVSTMLSGKLLNFAKSQD